MCELMALGGSFNEEQNVQLRQEPKKWEHDNGENNPKSERFS